MEADLLPAHYRFTVTPMYFDDGAGNAEWLTANGAFNAALAAASGNVLHERLRHQPYDAAELYRMWSSNLPCHPARPHFADEHREVFEAAALARGADLAVDRMTNTSRPRRVTSRQSPPPPTCRPTRWLADVAMSGIGHLR